MSYQASQIKRHRATKAEVEERRDALFDIVADMQPMTVRQVFYQATVRGIVEKTEAGYAKVQTDLVDHAPRRRAALRLARRQHPLAAQAAHLRQRRARRSHETAAVLSQGALGRRRLPTSRSGWRRTRSPASSIRSPTHYDVPLMVARGYASLSFLHSAAEYINELEVPPTSTTSATSIRPASMPARRSRRRCASWRRTPRSIFERHRRHAGADRALGPADAADQDDATAGPRASATISVELDAIEPDLLRALVQDAIERHLPAEQFEVLKAAEESERELIAGLSGKSWHDRRRARPPLPGSAARPAADPSQRPRHGRAPSHRGAAQSTRLLDPLRADDPAAICAATGFARGSRGTGVLHRRAFHPRASRSLVAYLDATHPSGKQHIEPVALPVPEGMVGYGVLPVGGTCDFHMLSKTRATICRSTCGASSNCDTASRCRCGKGKTASKEPTGRRQPPADAPAAGPTGRPAFFTHPRLSV